MLDMINATSGLYHEVAILEKGGVFSAIALSRLATNGLTVLGRNDPRSQPMINNSPQHCLNGGKTNFENSIRHSRDNGWMLVWRGFPYGRTN